MDETSCFVGTLPVEILQEIFFECVGETDGYIIGEGAAPFVLSHVCRHWRKVAISTPALWTDMFVELDQRRTHHSHPLLVNLWLQRSGTLPLTLNIADLLSPDPSAEENPVFALLLAHIHRWRHVEWFIWGGSTAKLFLHKTLNNGETLLESLTISTQGCTDEQSELFPFALQSFTRLRRLTYASNTLTSVFNLPLSQLTHLRLSSVPLDICGRVLTRCAKLEEIAFMDISQPLGDMTTTIIYLPELVSCTFQSYESNIGALLMQFDSPKLRSLVLYCNYSLQGEINTLETFVARAGCKLRTFIFHDKDLSEDELERLLAQPALESIQILELSCDNISDQILGELTAGDDGQILPLLKTIILEPCCSSDGKLAAMISSRWSEMGNFAGRALAHVDVTFQLPSSIVPTRYGGREAIRLAHKNDIMCFQHFIDQGLDLSWV
ncbi:hypothetical protein Hypma_006254 [Hypsizygus marmoreus]|uniref:Uncharacterized protein n=1 Tax=Hypsizygus marmoreus TaxID=39966 RepID=A0A369K1Y4_HYPMA|nr:hypothetical protein Hypma_006254 [Hypsizygus marmoreus]